MPLPAPTNVNSPYLGNYAPFTMVPTGPNWGNITFQDPNSLGDLDALSQGTGQLGSPLSSGWGGDAYTDLSNSGSGASPTSSMSLFNAIMAGLGIAGQGVAQRNVLNQQEGVEQQGIAQQKAYQDQIDNTINQLVGKMKTDTPAAATASARSDYLDALNSGLGPEYGSTGAKYGKAYNADAASEALNQRTNATTLATLLGKVAGPNIMRRNEGYGFDSTASTVGEYSTFAKDAAAANKLQEQSIQENPYGEMLFNALKDL